jgi:hypothetical protein
LRMPARGERSFRPATPGVSLTFFPLGMAIAGDTLRLWGKSRPLSWRTARS